MIELQLVICALMVGVVVLGAGLIVLPVGLGLAVVALGTVAALCAVGVAMRVVGWMVSAMLALLLSIVAVPFVLLLSVILTFGALLALAPAILPLAVIGFVIWLCARRRSSPRPALPAT